MGRNHNTPYSEAFLIFISFQPSVHHSGYSRITRCHPARAACFDEPRTWIHLSLWALRKQTGWHSRVFLQALLKQTECFPAGKHLCGALKCGDNSALSANKLSLLICPARCACQQVINSLPRLEGPET